MTTWPLSEIRKQIAELAQTGAGGKKLLEILANGKSCAPTECDQLDFKLQVNNDEIGLSEACRDIVAFYNMYGGYIVVGVAELENETFEVVGAEAGFDIERLKSKIKDLTGERILITQEACTWELPSNGVAQVFILNIPARPQNENPLSFTKDGPGKGVKGKRIFEKGDIPIREGDETTKAQGAKVVEIWQSQPHPLVTNAGRREITPLRRVTHNLPDRNIICPQVVGRKDALEHLWRWLPDDLSHVKVLAGEGGIGKSSIAYEFADRISLLTNQSFHQVVWLSAKQRQFRPLTNSYNEIAETHFGTYDELLDRICDFLPITDTEKAESPRPKKLRLIKNGFEFTPSFLVVDDIDSLEETEQRQALELGFLLSGTKTKLLLTTRNNIIYSGDVCYTVRGIDKQEFPAFFEALMARFPSPTRRIPKSNEIDRIWEASKGSPLFAESILRLLAYQNVGEAIGHWKGEAGDEVRKAALHREIQQLSPEARRILLTLALLSEASLAELAEVTGYAPARVAMAIQNLSSLFLVEAPKLGTENRIRVSETTGRLVLSIRRELATDHVRLEKAIKDFRTSANAEQPRASNKLVGAAILQASALERQGNITEALETLKYAARKTAKGKKGDLLAYIGYLYTRISPPNFDLAQQTCREAYNEGCLKKRLFETWFSAEWERGNFPGTEEIARAALDATIEPIYEWRIRLAAALTSKAHAQGGGRISVSALPAYLEASKELSKAIEIIPIDEAYRWRSSLEDANDAIYNASSEAITTTSDRITLIRHLINFIRQGDWRIRNYTRTIVLISEIWNSNTKARISTRESAVHIYHDEIQDLIEQRLNRFPNDERHENLWSQFCNLRNKLKKPESFADPQPDLKQKNTKIEPRLAIARQEHSLDGVTISSSNIEIDRPALPDHLSADKTSKFYVKECFDFKIGIIFNEVERSDVQEYCVSEGWIMVPSKKTVDRKGKKMLIKINGKVEPFYK